VVLDFSELLEVGVRDVDVCIVVIVVMELVWAIDDVGLEEPVNDYGNKAFVFSKIIQERYANKHLMQYYPLHITSMLTAEQIGEKYGDFVRSRMREQFNTIQYKGKDRRK
jgi:DNA replication protein DnaC